MKKSLIMRALAFCWLALLSCQAQTKREWLRLNSEMPWAAIQLEAPNKLLNQAVVYTELSILGVNTTGSNIPPDTSHIQLHNSDILLDSTETQAAIGRNYEFLLPLIDFAPITLRDAYGPCSALFLWNAKGLSFTSVSSFEFNPPPISLDLEIKVEIADPTFSFNTEQAIPSRATTFFVLTTASNGEDPTIHLDGKPGAPPIKDRFSSISVSYGCNTGSNVVNFILNSYNGTSFSYTLDQTWASNPGNQILITVVAASSAPSTPDYVIYFAQGSKSNTQLSPPHPPKKTIYFTVLTSHKQETRIYLGTG